MKAIVPVLAAALLLACSCSSPARIQGGPGAERVGAPSPAADPALLGRQAQADPAGAPIRLPERIALPASYRLLLLDGHLALVRESDEQALEPAPASMRIVTGEIARGELAYQPGLLPQELAAEVAANRESSARMDNALGSVMRRSRELSDQAAELGAQSRRLAEMLAAAQARVRELEGAARAAPAPPAAAPDPKAAQD
jgi:hypothetical protein